MLFSSAAQALSKTEYPPFTLFILKGRTLMQKKKKILMHLISLPTQLMPQASDMMEAVEKKLGTDVDVKEKNDIRLLARLATGTNGRTALAK